MTYHLGNTGNESESDHELDSESQKEPTMKPRPDLRSLFEAHAKDKEAMLRRTGLASNWAGNNVPCPSEGMKVIYNVVSRRTGDLWLSTTNKYKAEKLRYEVNGIIFAVNPETGKTVAMERTKGVPKPPKREPKPYFALPRRTVIVRKKG